MVEIKVGAVEEPVPPLIEAYQSKLVPVADKVGTVAFRQTGFGLVTGLYLRFTQADILT